MAVELPNSIFIHIPKTAGRWIEQQLIDHVSGARWLGDPILDAHASPDLPPGKRAWAFVREPALLCHSLWHHRSKPIRTRGSQWNWQDYIRLEQECGSSNYHEFMDNCGECQDGVAEFYQHYIQKYPDCRTGKMESLLPDLLGILEEMGETFDGDAIAARIDSPIGSKGSRKAGRLRPEQRSKINRANREFCLKYGYPL